MRNGLRLWITHFFKGVASIPRAAAWNLLCHSVTDAVSSPASCAIAQWSGWSSLPETAVSSRRYRDRNLCSEFSKSVIEAIEGLLENRTRCGKVEAQPGFAAWPELLTGACENARPILDPCRDVLGRQSGAGEVDPCKIGCVEPHRPCAWRCAFDPAAEDIATAGEIGQQCIEPAISGSPGRFGGDHAEGVVGGKAARRDPRIDLLL